ncbi:tRNA (N(6)-L-threonylcarbamoyladenosine(37)-C(2))-methylthiotransferase MtaB [Sphingomonas sp. CGMCC 1.13654]|uniref:tRNA (N(6)-L-threonylcarbamoyladenosine(37)-C(2))-methylthiotransferase n=1 Tax=Sphingomonas chungangi TaxID=2683589 RepID=A0A838LC56_9SPHN|nr:tRNA (N(6)-L-threonylcarbamoyladenosine(37)-C(2))-methylthiotransferase MtaB [Sphingomonas chungangi]MVW55690.1 tRNA (N(6)-L-threonylcarbamoyladenosine(37)-C(2))-methylthiotransferase MtaB [Sphingomonas chungangi]
MRALAGDRDDLVIVNSCAVTAEAVKQARKEIRRAAKRRPGARIVVTGCAAQVEPERFASMPEVAAVIGNREKWEAASFGPSATARDPLALSEVQVRGPSAPPAARPSTSLRTNGMFGATLEEKIRVSDIMAVRDTAPHLAAGFGDRARAFVEVQNGCDHRCTFCIIPFARGPSRSVPAGLVVDRIKALVDEGYNEVVLTGVDATSYGPDLPGDQSLGHLVERVLRLVPGLARLRLSSLDSVEIDDRLFDLVTGERRIQPHLHLSLQAGDDMILKRMKRRHLRAQSVAMVERLKAKRPEIAIGADLIAGFPTETEAQALNSVALLDDCDIVHAHVFPFSPRADTPAARMPALDPVLVAARARRLREAAEARRGRWLETLVGTEQSLLVERIDGRGHTAAYAPARLASGAAPRGAATNAVRRGDVVAIRVTHIEGEMLVGEAL